MKTSLEVGVLSNSQETEALGTQWHARDHTAAKGWNWDSNPALDTPNFRATLPPVRMTDFKSWFCVWLLASVYLCLSISAVATDTGSDLPPLCPSCACFLPSRLPDGEAMFCSVPVYLPSPQTWWDFHAQPHLTHGGAHTLPIVWMYDIPSHMVYTHLTSLHSHIPNKSINALRNRYCGVQLEIKWNIS